MYVNHLTLATGHVSRIHRGDVAGEALARVAPWLGAMAQSGSPAPLPVSAVSDYTASAAVSDGALIVTISAGSGRAPPPLVTLGVAKHSRHGAALWPLLTGPSMPRIKTGLQSPAEPWCAVILWPSLALHPSAAAWLGDLERCIAWAWCTRPEDAA